MAYREERQRPCAAPAETLWDVVAGIGGDQGWYGFDRLWRLRAGLDRALGGPGMRGRPARLSPGSAVDFWVVEDLQAPVSLTLRAQMRLPGTARLTLRVEPAGSGSELVQQVGFDPAGPAGYALWWSELPAHRVVFGAMADGLVAEAERRAAAASA